VPIIFHYSLPVVLNSVAQAAMGCYFLIAKEFRYGYCFLTSSVFESETASIKVLRVFGRRD